jgi:hypothetical protein
MMRKLRKMTVGFVVQEYVELGDTLVPVGQEFTAGDEVTWEDVNGEVVDTPVDHVYQPFEMVQPEVQPKVQPEELEYDGTPVRKMSAEEMEEFDERVRQAEEEDERWRNSERRRVEEERLRRAEELRLRRAEELRRDEKRGLYPGVIDPAN